MKHTLNIFGKSIEIDDEQLERVREMLGIKPVQLCEVPEGEVFTVGQRDFVVLEHRVSDTIVILKDIYICDVEYGKNNRYDGSNADAICTEFFDEICKTIGSENVEEFELDLTSDDGLKDYGVVKRAAALLTAEMYRKYVDILDKYMPNEYWWLSTPHSTKRHGNDCWVKCVSPSGDFYNFIYFNDCGVRPFCIFNSSIFVSI